MNAHLSKPKAVVAIAIVFYLAISLDHLTSFPKIGEDEPWIAAAPYKLATQGVYGSDLFAGYYGVERHNYQQMPLFPLIEAGVFRVFGVGVAQMRALPVAFGLLLIIVVYATGAAMGGARVGALGAVLLVALSVAAVPAATGIVLIDRARVNRYDVAVPVFGLLAFLMFLRVLGGEPDRAPPANGRGRAGAAALCGMLVGLAGLSHLYGIFWLPALAVVLVLARGWRALVEPPLRTIAAGVAGTWLPWAAFVASGWRDYRGQMLFVAPRFDVLNPSFYAANLLHGPGPLSVDWLRQTVPTVPWHHVGTWVALAGIPVALAMMWRSRPPRSAPHGPAIARSPAAVFSVVSVVQLAMFVLLLKVKTYSYTIAIWPLGVLCLAWLGILLWDRYRFAAVRTALAAVLLAIVAQGGAAVVRAHQEAVVSTPYDFYEREVARCIPTGARVLGLQHYWLGLRQFDYRTWLMPLDMAHPLYSYDPVPFERAIERVDPDVVLIDPYMDEMLSEAAAPGHPNHRYYEGWNAFAARRHVTPACLVRDPTYGTMKVYVVPQAARQ